MMTKTALSRNAIDSDDKSSPLIAAYLAEIKTLRKEMAAKRASGRKTLARIDRNLEQIQTTLSRVAGSN
jgi:hypothetical protein